VVEEFAELVLNLHSKAGTKLGETAVVNVNKVACALSFSLIFFQLPTKVLENVKKILDNTVDFVIRILMRRLKKIICPYKIGSRAVNIL